MVNPGKILLNHGSGGTLTHDLIDNLFVNYFDNEILRVKADSSVVEMYKGLFACTTDSYVIDPLFFPGGDIGKLAICGTVNDLAVSGAKPLYISAAFIIEEGFSMELLEKIVSSMQAEAEKAGVKIIAGDTKVVNKGKCDKIFINTTGIGTVADEHRHIHKGGRILAGDKIIINGNIGDHEAAIISARNLLPLKSDIVSDCKSLNYIIERILLSGNHIKFMRDATRGGLGGILNEIVNKRDIGIELDEKNIPINEQVKSICEILGFDPLFMANEGKFVVVVAEKDANKVLDIIKQDADFLNAAIIGEVVDKPKGMVLLKTEIGGKRIIDVPAGEQLPRIC
jgi:hydrogenase expression/formation protein HypE